MSSAASSAQRLDLGAILLEKTRLRPEQLEEAVSRQSETTSTLAEVLIDGDFLRSDEVLTCLAELLGLEFRDEIDLEEVDPEIATKVPIAFAKQHQMLPLGLTADRRLSVATARPFDTTSLDDLRLVYGVDELDLFVVPEAAVVAAINRIFDFNSDATDELAEAAEDDLDALATEISHEPQDLLDATDDAPIIRLVNSLLQHAVKERASDIHIEPFERDIRVRFRIDDVLYEPMKPLPRSLQASIASRIKIMGGLDIAEKRLPQDGRIRLKIAGRDYDVRLSTIPISHGERLVLRLLPDSQALLDLAKIGFRPQQIEMLERIIRRPNGIFLVTGPTGSGKTTTLHSALSRINRPELNILTVEDPVEIQQPGISQIEVNSKIGLTFSGGLRSILRQDPNVVLVGEIRDLETAEIAIQASLTGHLVLSTIHTNDAASTITRLVDMGVEPFLVGSSLVAVLAQRLVRVLCKECRESYTPTTEELAEIGITETDAISTVYRPDGCPECNQTGYRGRIGIFEMMLIDDELRSMVSTNVDSKTIKLRAVGKGMGTLRHDGARKVIEGMTSIAEVIRATEEEGNVAQI